MNISLTGDQMKLVDKLTQTMDYANRSEFFRSLLRLVAREPELLAKADEVVLEAPAATSVAQIKRQLKNSGRYSAKFINSVGRGLLESGYFMK